LPKGFLAEIACQAGYAAFLTSMTSRLPSAASEASISSRRERRRWSRRNVTGYTVQASPPFSPLHIVIKQVRRPLASPRPSVHQRSESWPGSAHPRESSGRRILARFLRSCLSIGSEPRPLPPGLDRVRRPREWIPGTGRGGALRFERERSRRIEVPCRGSGTPASRSCKRLTLDGMQAFKDSPEAPAGHRRRPFRLFYREDGPTIANAPRAVPCASRSVR
jgi:hypothetical protein